MKIEDIMSTPAIVATVSTSVWEVARLMKDNQIGFVPIVDNERIVGVVTDRDIVVRAFSYSDLNERIELVMTPNPLCVVPGTSVMTVAKMMVSQAVGRMVITKDGKPLGVISAKDLLKAPQTLPYFLALANVPHINQAYQIYANVNPHDGVNVDDYPL